MDLPSREGLRVRVARLSRRQVAVRLGVAVLVLAVVAAAGFYAYFGVFAHHAPVEVRESVRTNPNVTVTESYGGCVVTDADPAPERLGVVFYPGGRVAPDAYLPTAARIAERANVTVVVPKVTANLAVFSIDRADAVIDGEPAVRRWVVGGHSLGGAMACRYAAENAVEGLVLVGAYCDRSVGDVPALAVVGTRDAVVNRERFVENRDLLGSNPTVARVTGMNHSQAGWYTGQRGGQPAGISTEEAHRRLADEVADWLCADLDHCENGTGRTRAAARVVPEGAANGTPTG